MKLFKAIHDRPFDMAVSRVASSGGRSLTPDPGSLHVTRLRAHGSNIVMCPAPASLPARVTPIPALTVCLPISLIVDADLPEGRSEGIFYGQESTR